MPPPLFCYPYSTVYNGFPMEQATNKRVEPISIQPTFGLLCCLMLQWVSVIVTLLVHDIAAQNLNQLMQGKN